MNESIEPFAALLLEVSRVQMSPICFMYQILLLLLLLLLIIVMITIIHMRHSIYTYCSLPQYSLFITHQWYQSSIASSMALSINILSYSIVAHPVNNLPLLWGQQQQNHLDRGNTSHGAGWPWAIVVTCFFKEPHGGLQTDLPLEI